MSTGREHDIMELYKLYYEERHYETRQKIMESIKLLKNESEVIGSMREALLKAHRQGEVDEIKDIHDFIEGKGKYRH